MSRSARVGCVCWTSKFRVCQGFGRMLVVSASSRDMVSLSPTGVPCGVPEKELHLALAPGFRKLNCCENPSTPTTSTIARMREGVFLWACYCVSVEKKYDGKSQADCKTNIIALSLFRASSSLRLSPPSLLFSLSAARCLPRLSMSSLSAQPSSLATSEYRGSCAGPVAIGAADRKWRAGNITKLYWGLVSMSACTLPRH